MWIVDNLKNFLEFFFFFFERNSDEEVVLVYKYFLIGAMELVHCTEILLWKETGDISVQGM